MTPEQYAEYRQTHTRGPWKLQDLGEIGNTWGRRAYAIRSPANVCLAVIGEVDAWEHERNHANARLMQHAPEMLAALHRALAALDDAKTLHPNWIYSDAQHEVREAIKTATT